MSLGVCILVRRCAFLDLCSLGLGSRLVFLHALLHVVDRLAEGAAELRQVLRPEDHKGNDEDNEHFRCAKTAKHSAILWQAICLQVCEQLLGQ